MPFDKIDELGRRRVPFFFIINFDATEGVVLPLDKLSKVGICLDFNGKIYGSSVIPKSSIEKINISPINFNIYREAFNKVMDEIIAGNSYLLNLTFPTEVITRYSLEDIFVAAKAPYKFYYKDKFVFFSPEPFVQINNGVINSFPMKGTINAMEPNALNKLMNSNKELFEHYTIVDLIRNDLALVSNNVCVNDFRYCQKIQTESNNEIYQTSSLISGVLDTSWIDNIGGLFRKILPAGSISGAPKRKTLEIINSAEIDNRGFYTGVTGVFDGVNLESCVNIRYIERICEGKYIYRSGGGITCNSICEEEYNELITKVYVPHLF